MFNVLYYTAVIVVIGFEFLAMTLSANLNHLCSRVWQVCSGGI